MATQIAFEMWAEKQGRSIEKDSDGLYVDKFVSGLWMSWLAARESAAGICDGVAEICLCSGVGAQKKAGFNAAKSCAKLIRGA